MRGHFGIALHLKGILQIRQSRFRIAFQEISPTEAVVDGGLFGLLLVGGAYQFECLVHFRIRHGQHGVAEGVLPVRIIGVQFQVTAQVGNRLFRPVQFIDVHQRALIKDGTQVLGIIGPAGDLVVEEVQFLQSLLRIVISADYQQLDLQQVVFVEETALARSHGAGAFDFGRRLPPFALFQIQRSHQNGFVETEVRCLDFVRPFARFGKFFVVAVAEGGDNGRPALLFLRAMPVGFGQIVHCFFKRCLAAAG